MIRVIALSIIIALFSGCKDSDNEEVIPYVQFYGYVYLSDPYYVNTSFIALTDENRNTLGISGVVVYRLTSESYYAYDLVCPYEKSTAALVKIDPKDDGHVVCPKCGSTYSISGGYGDIVKGPSKYPLKAYSTQYEPSDNTLAIWNQ